MDKTKIINGKITDTKLGELCGCLTAYLIIEGDGGGCNFGGYCLDHWFAEIGQHKSFDGYGAIIEIMKTVGVESWEKLKGADVRVEVEELSGKVIKIWHIKENKWFSFKDYFSTISILNEQKVDDDEKGAIMISKEIFIQTIERLKTLDEKMSKVDDAMKELDSDFCGFYITDIFNITIRLLEEIFHDTENNWLCYFIWERNWLQDFTLGDITVNNEPVKINNWEDVYDFLINNMRGDKL